MKLPKFPIFLTRNHLKNCRQWMTRIRTACYCYSGSWVVIEIMSHFLPKFGNWSRGNLWLLTAILLGGFLVGLVQFALKCRKMLSVTQELEAADVSVEIRVGDIFKMEGAFIISTNTTFDTDMSCNRHISDFHLIHPDSLQGQFTKRYYDKVEHLDSELEDALKNEEPTAVEESIGKSKRYEIGTVVKVIPRDQVVYLVAITDMDKNGKVSSHPEDVLKSLAKLWHYVRMQGGYGPLVIPVLGTGRARGQVKREQMVREIIRSFIAACAEEKFCEKLTVVVSEDDYRKHNIDLQELGKQLYVHATQERWKIRKSEKPRGQSIQ